MCTTEMQKTALVGWGSVTSDLTVAWGVSYIMTFPRPHTFDTFGMRAHTHTH